MVIREEQERVRTLLCDTITLLCRNGLSFKNEFNISAVIGITLDKEDVFLVDIRETIKNQSGDASDSGESEKVTEKSSKRNRKRRKRSHSIDNHADSESETELSEPVVKQKKVEQRLEVKTEIVNESDDEDLVFVKNEPAFFSSDLSGSYSVASGGQDSNMSHHSQTTHQQYQDSGGPWNTSAPPTFEHATPSTSDTSLLQQQPGQMNLDASVAQEYWEEVDEIPTSARKKTPHLFLTNEQRDNIVDWFEQHPCLYDRTHEDFKLPPDEKSKLWKEKAHDLNLPNVDGTRLKMWMDGMRTLYGKLTKVPAGQRLSHRNKWVLRKLHFLKDHIHRQVVPRKTLPNRTRRRNVQQGYGFYDESYLTANHSAMGDEGWENVRRVRRKKIPPLHLSKDVQNDIADWFRDHPCFYDRTHEHFHGVDEKLKMWEEKARELNVAGVDGVRLKKWVESVRTAYGKLSRQPPDARKSWRKRWILEKWAFLGEHIFRKHSTTLQPVMEEGDDYSIVYANDLEET